MVENIPGLAEAQPLTHIEALELDVVSEHLIVLGAGYVGLEFAQAMRRFGSKVTLAGRSQHVIHNEDHDVTEGLETLFRDEGVDMVLNSKIQRVSGVSGQSVHVTIEQEGVQRTLDGTHILVATGRVPNTKDIGLESAGVELTEKGYIRVNERLRQPLQTCGRSGRRLAAPIYAH